MTDIKKMNRTIAKWLYGDGKVKNGDGYTHWMLKKDSSLYQIDFDKDYNLLMQAFEKVLDKDFWYAVHPTQKNFMKKIKSTDKRFYCSFTAYGMGRMGYGDKLNYDFMMPTPILAMHYSLYRLITNGLEY